MKKICRTIKLRKLKTDINIKSLEKQKNKDFVVLFDDGKYERVYSKEDLISLLERDHIRSIWYIFDMTDRIILDRDTLINIDNI